VCAALLVTGCLDLPEGRYAISAIDLRGNYELSDEDLEQQLASRETAKFLGLFPGLLYEYEVFDRYVLERDLQRIERYYRARGYYHAKVRAGRVYYGGGQKTRIEILIDEGDPALIESVRLEGLEGLSEGLQELARSALQSQLEPGEPLTEAGFEAAADEIQTTLTDQGYAQALVERQAEVNLAENSVHVRYTAVPGPLTQIGEIHFEGLDSIPLAPVRRALDIQSGELYSSSDIEEAERAVLNLGVFSSVAIAPDLGTSSSEPAAAEGVADRVPLRVKVEPNKLRGVHLGGGINADTIRTDLHLTAGWEHRNLFGGFQHFLVEAVPGVVLHPTRIPVLEAPERFLPQGRLRGEYRSPGVLEARTNLLLRAQGSVFPVLLTPDTPDDFILGYQDYRAGIGLERTLWRFYGSLSQNLQVNRPFTYRGELDPDLGTALISYPELRAILDLRDETRRRGSESAREDELRQDRLGVYLSATAQFAGLGGHARDTKLEPEARFYVGISRELTLALRAGVGLLFPRNYGQTIDINARTGLPGAVSRATWVRDVQLTSLRGLYAGGASSNRGYAAREIGPHGSVPFFIPGLTSEEIGESCDLDSPEFDAANCDVPLGGFTSYEASIELRYPLKGPLSGTVFSDSADVSGRELDFRFNRPHLSVGVGLRYETPVGPIRLDIGYRLPGLQAPRSPDEGVPEEVFGLPVAVALGIGEAF
jgi:outer membrane protein assembly factor BamA